MMSQTQKDKTAKRKDKVEDKHTLIKWLQHGGEGREGSELNAANLSENCIILFAFHKTSMLAIEIPHNQELP